MFFDSHQIMMDQLKSETDNWQNFCSPEEVKKLQQYERENAKKKARLTQLASGSSGRLWRPNAIKHSKNLSDYIRWFNYKC